MPPKKHRRDVDEVVEEATRHTVPGLAAPQPVVIVPFTADGGVESPAEAGADEGQGQQERDHAELERIEQAERELEQRGQAERQAREELERAELDRQEQERQKREHAERELLEREERQRREQAEREREQREEAERQAHQELERQEQAERERLEREQAEQEAAKAKRNGRARNRALVRPTTAADCKRDPRVKHTLMVHKEVQKRLQDLQYAETMAAGREQPMWPHVDAALAVLHPAKEPDLAKWVERAENLLGEDPDKFSQFGPLMRTSTREGIRTLRVRLKRLDAETVAQHHVVTAALVAYLDAWDAQGRQAPQG